MGTRDKGEGRSVADGLFAIASAIERVADVGESVASALGDLAEATDGLLYGLKYSKAEGTSVAEAIENAGHRVEDAATAVARSIEALSE